MNEIRTELGDLPDDPDVGQLVEPGDIDLPEPGPTQIIDGDDDVELSENQIAEIDIDDDGWNEYYPPTEVGEIGDFAFDSVGLLASTAPTQAEMIKVAAREIGEREGKNNSNKYGKYFGVDGTAWCAQFVCWVAEKAGAKRGQLFPNTAWCPTLLDFARDHDLIVIDPAKGDRSGRIYPGDIFLIQRLPSEDPNWKNGAKHVGIVEKDLGDWRIQTIEGNTSTNGSAQGNGVYRLIRQMNNGRIVVFRPKYAKAPAGGGGGSKPSTAKTVDLSQLIAAAKADPGRKQGGTTSGAADDVKVVEAALKAEGLLSSKYASDGSFGSTTIAAYAKWQRSKAGGDYEGGDANGVPGRDSLERLGKRNNFNVKG